MKPACKNCKFWGSDAATIEAGHRIAPCTSSNSPVFSRWTQDAHTCPSFEPGNPEKGSN
jgi:hypothetical protein